MTPLVLIGSALFFGVIVAVTLAWGAPYLALPILAVVGVPIWLVLIRRRQQEAQSMQGFRRQAESEPVDFTDRDKQTLA